MTTKSHSNLVQDSPEWHEWRKGGIGASEIAAIIGVCPYNTPHGVWLVKTGRSKGFEGNSFTEHGKAREGAARARYELMNMDDMPPACATHPQFAICRASLDGWSEATRKILEIKCPKTRTVLDAALAGKVADHYLPQVHYQMGVAGADSLDFFVWHEDSKTDALVTVSPDIQYQGRLFAAADEFWNLYVLTDTAPALTERDVKVIEDDATIMELCADLLAQKDSASKASLEKLKAEIIKRAGHPKMRCGRVQISTVNRNGKFSFHKLTVADEAEKKGA